MSQWVIVKTKMHSCIQWLNCDLTADVSCLTYSKCQWNICQRTHCRFHLQSENYTCHVRHHSFFCFFCCCFLSDSFVNSQEWTLSRSVPELKVVSIFYFVFIFSPKWFYHGFSFIQFHHTEMVKYQWENMVSPSNTSFVFHMRENVSNWLDLFAGIEFFFFFYWDVLAHRCKVAYSRTRRWVTVLG